MLVAWHAAFVNHLRVDFACGYRRGSSRSMLCNVQGTVAPDALASPPQSQPIFSALAEAVFGELIESVSLVVAGASGARWEALNGPSDQWRTGDYIPPAPSIFPHVLPRLLADPSQVHAAWALTSYYERLAVLRRHHAADSAVTVAISVPRSRTEEFALWIDLLDAGRQAMQVVALRAPAATFPDLGDELSGILEQIDQIEAGGCPCVGSDGRIRVPLRSERRRSIRRATRKVAFFYACGELKRVTIVDICSGGACVSGLGHLGAGTPVHLLLRPGVSARGLVAWSSSNNAGIAFDQPLPSDCGLLEDGASLMG